MARITSTKVRAVDPPAWRRYPGVSLLYDNPGCAQLSGLERLESLPAARQRDDRLYRRLAALADELVIAARDAELAVSPLPRRTYHVTLCDGVNRGVRSRVPEEHRAEVDAFLEALPDSLLWPTAVLRLLADPELRWRARRDPVTFRLHGLDAWGHALVARLAPAGEQARAAMARHDAARADLAARLEARLGVTLGPWRPHVTLGYFANEDDAARAREALLPAWAATVADRVGDATVTFRSAGVYGFTDMATFWRLGR